jgi:predicted metal-dependent hydrolase
MARWKNPAEFKSRVKHWADKLDIKIRWLALRPMSRKWASCSANGNLNFNTELLGLDRDVGEYVIVHELLHFAVPHHGKLWKSLMRAHLGDYERLDKKLKSSRDKRSPILENCTRH